MLQAWLVVLISLGYVGLLFAIAYYGDQRARRHQVQARPIVYSLTLAVFCTSWGFFGAVGQAASFGWAYAPPLGSPLLLVPSYVAPILMYLLLPRFWEKLARVGKRQKITSIADFISARYGKSQSLAALVAIIALIGIIPYVALQLKSVSLTYQILTGSGIPGADAPFWQDTALYVALLMALFAILFGTRQIDATEHNEGMMLAVAFESVVKLVAFLVVGAFITFGMFDGFADLAARLAAQPRPAEVGAGGYVSAFFTQVVLGGIVLFCLPRLFHVAVVENTNPRDVYTARWLYPLYLVLFGLFVWPVAAAGLLYFGPGAIDADTYMLTLPVAADQPALAVLSFIGGFSAGTSMVIVASVALSIMVCNDVVMPLLLRSRRLRLNERKDLSRLLLLIRRCAITGLLLLAYGYYRLTAEFVALASFGVLAFVAAAQFAPAVVGGLYWKQGSRRGVMIGMGAGFALWCYTLLLPMLTRAGMGSEGLLLMGPFGIDWLRPTALFGLEGLDTATHGSVWSLAVNLACYIGFSLRDRRRLLERVQAAAFVDLPHDPADSIEPARGSINIEDLQILAERFLGPTRAEQLFSTYGKRTGHRLQPAERAAPELIEQVERLMAAVLGASSARVVLDSALRGRRIQPEEVANIVGEASQVLQFNRELLQVTFESVSQGIIVVDRELRLVAWNQRYAEMFDYPEGFLKVGKRIAEMIRYNVERGEYGPMRSEQDIGAAVSASLTLFRQHTPYIVERSRPNGTVFEIRGNPMPGGGFVTTYSDITEHKRTEQALRESEQNIRVYTDNVPALIAYIDKERRFRFVNRSYEMAFGVKREAIYGERVDAVLPETSLRHRWPYMEAVLAGAPQRFQVEMTTADGGLRHVSGTYIPDFGSGGEVLGFFALFHDISERVEAERALREAKQGLEQRVETRTRELTAANEALRAAKGEAERANQSKTRFLAGASHDLLQPLNAAGLFCSALSQRLERADDRHLAGNIEAALRSAEGLLSELLDISKLDAGALKPQLSDFDLGELLQELAVEFQLVAQRKGLQLRAARCRQSVRSDRQLLRRVLQNFLSNAIRYTPRGRVLIGCRRQGGMLRVEVWDTGTGIPDDQRQKIFEEFHRIDHHDQQGEKCLGLGLAITERIGRMLGHPINVRSWPGRGSVFALALPRSDVQAPPLPAPVRQAPPGALDGLRVLCVDNEPSIVAGMAALLGGWGCEVVIAGDLETALAALEVNERLDAMLVDYRLGGGRNGIDLMDAVRSHFELEVPGVVITADHAEAIRKAVQARGYRFMHKPVKPAALRALLSQLHQSRRTGTAGAA